MLEYVNLNVNCEKKLVFEKVFSHKILVYLKMLSVNQEK
jgi:hypothetical protein